MRQEDSEMAEGIKQKRELDELFKNRDSQRNSGAINIIFDGPPSHESGRFVEVENDAGESIKIGEWKEQDNGFWALRITELPAPGNFADALDILDNLTIRSSN